MFHVFRSGLPKSLAVSRFTLSSSVALAFLAGAISGALIGTYTAANVLQINWIPDFATSSGTGFFSALFHAVRYQLLLILCAASLFGILMIPALSFFRAFVMSCSAAAILRADPLHGLSAALFTIGLPALTGVPCFLISATDAMNLSGRLCRLSFSRPPVDSIDPGGYAKRAIAVLIVCAAEALYTCYILPRIGFRT